MKFLAADTEIEPVLSRLAAAVLKKLKKRPEGNGRFSV
jgi:hypothetical protein